MKQFKKLVSKIEESNEVFSKMSLEEKRVEVAKDLIERIKIGQLFPETGRFTKFIKKYENNVKTLLNSDSETVCEVCAKGGLLMSYIGRVNQVDRESLGIFSNDSDSFEHRKLAEIFSYEQLSLIEFAFEGEKFLYLNESGEIIHIDLENSIKAQNFYEKYDDPSKRLLLIARNIIRNKGTFKL